MIEVRSSGTDRGTCGRAAATANPAMEASSRPTGTWRFHAARGGIAARMRATLENCTACRRRRRNCHR